MSFKNDFMNDLNETLETRLESQGIRPSVEIWPDDEFGLWVMRHEDPVRSVICATPEFGDTPFCGVGYH